MWDPQNPQQAADPLRECRPQNLPRAVVEHQIRQAPWRKRREIFRALGGGGGATASPATKSSPVSPGANGAGPNGSAPGSAGGWIIPGQGSLRVFLIRDKVGSFWGGWFGSGSA